MSGQKKSKNVTGAILKNPYKVNENVYLFDVCNVKFTNGTGSMNLDEYTLRTDKIEVNEFGKTQGRIKVLSEELSDYITDLEKGLGEQLVPALKNLMPVDKNTKTTCKPIMYNGLIRVNVPQNILKTSSVDALNQDWENELGVSFFYKLRVWVRYDTAEGLTWGLQFILEK